MRPLSPSCDVGDSKPLFATFTRLYMDLLIFQELAPTEQQQFHYNTRSSTTEALHQCHTLEPPLVNTLSFPRLFGNGTNFQRK